MKTLKELYLEAARVAEMIEGSDLAIGDCVKYRNEPMNNWVVVFNNEPDLYEFALAIVGGKPVFKGDALYYAGSKIIITDNNLFAEVNRSLWSWNPPKRTVMVEMLVEDVAEWAKIKTLEGTRPIYNRLGESSRKALFNLKG